MAEGEGFELEALARSLRGPRHARFWRGGVGLSRAPKSRAEPRDLSNHELWGNLAEGEGFELEPGAGVSVAGSPARAVFA